MLPALPTLSHVLVGASLPASLSSGAKAQTRFPFAMPWDDASHNALDASDLNPAPIAEMQRLHIANGHFVDASGQRADENTLCTDEGVDKLKKNSRQNV